MLHRYTATYDAEKAAQAHALFSPADRLNGRVQGSGNGYPGRPKASAVSVASQALRAQHQGSAAEWAITDVRSPKG